MKRNNKNILAYMLASLSLSAFLPINSQANETTAKTDFSNYYEISPEDLFVINTTKGEIIVALEPRLAPNHATRMRELVSEGFYDGIIFHRVIDGFMAQTGDPTGTGVGSSTKPDINGEFTFRRNAQFPFSKGVEKDGVVLGWVGAVPISTQTDALMGRTIDKSVNAWGNHCPAVMSMARADDPNSANSQFFLMRNYTASLDKKYSVWGYAVKGLDIIRAIKVVEPSEAGTPPIAADKMLKVTLVSKMDEKSRPRVFIEKSDSPGFQARLEKAIETSGEKFSNCDFGPDIKIIEAK